MAVMALLDYYTYRELFHGLLDGSTSFWVANNHTVGLEGYMKLVFMAHCTQEGAMRPQNLGNPDQLLEFSNLSRPQGWHQYEIDNGLQHPDSEGASEASMHSLWREIVGIIGDGDRHRRFWAVVETYMEQEHYARENWINYPP